MDEAAALFGFDPAVEGSVEVFTDVLAGEGIENPDPAVLVALAHELTATHGLETGPDRQLHLMGNPGWLGEEIRSRVPAAEVSTSDSVVTMGEAAAWFGFDPADETFGY